MIPPLLLPFWKSTRPPDAQAGLSLGGEGIRVVGIAGLASGKPRLTHHLHGDAPPPERLARHLQHLARTYGLQRLPWNISLDPVHYALFPFDAPRVPRREAAAAIRYLARDRLGFPVEEAVVDCFDIPADGKAAAPRKVYVVAARRLVVEGMRLLLDDARLKLTAIEVPEMGLNNLLRFLPDNDRGSGLLHLPGAGGPGSLILGREGRIHLLRRLEEAPTDAALLDLLQRSLGYCEHHFGLPPLATLYLALPPDREEAVRDLLRARLPLSVQHLDLPTFLPMEASVTRQALWGALPALGAALRPGEPP